MSLLCDGALRQGRSVQGFPISAGIYSHSSSSLLEARVQEGVLPIRGYTQFDGL